MNNAQLFKAAHALTKATIKAGDSYQVTFGAALKAIKAEQAAAQTQVANIAFAVMAFIIFVLVKIEAVLDAENTEAVLSIFLGLWLGAGLLCALHLVNVFTLLFTGSFLI